MEKKTIIANIIFYSFLAIVLVGMIYVIVLLKGSGAECVKNPFVYGATHSVGIKSQAGADNNPEVSCSCTVTSLGSPSTSFCFNNTEVRPDCSSPLLEGYFNFSK
jgi:hypothetical protein